MDILELPFIQHPQRPDFSNLEWSNLSSRFGNTIALTIQTTAEPISVKKDFETQIISLKQKIRYPTFLRLQDFVETVRNEKILKDKNLDFLFYIIDFFMKTTSLLDSAPLGGLAIYYARADCITPLHSHVFDRKFMTPMQLVCWFSKDKILFPQFWFVDGDKKVAWPKFSSSSNAYLINATKSHEGEAASSEILYFFSFCRNVDFSRLVHVNESGYGK